MYKNVSLRISNRDLRIFSKYFYISQILFKISFNSRHSVQHEGTFMYIKSTTKIKLAKTENTS